jgi:hypothetical protein
VSAQDPADGERGDGIHAEARGQAQQANQYQGVQNNTWYITQEPSTARSPWSAGVAALRAGQYQAAVAHLEDAFADPEQTEEAHFCLAVALFNGARPGLSKRPVVRRAEREIECILRLARHHAPALFLWAIVKEDYYLAGGFDIAPPAPVELVRLALSTLDPASDAAGLILDHVPTPTSPAWCMLRSRIRNQ